GVFAVHASVAALVDGGEARPQLLDRPESASHETETDGHEHHRERNGYVMVAVGQRGEAVKQHHRDQMGDREQTTGPQHRPKEKPPPERLWPRHYGPPMMR